MSSNIIIKNAQIVNEGQIKEADLFIKHGRIEQIGHQIQRPEKVEEIDAKGRWLLPGIIDVHVHFREPGLTHKAEISTGSRAALAGGVTSYMEMPNTKPPVLTQAILEDKYQRAAQKSIANYSFYMGVANDNLEEVLKTNKKKQEVCGLKIYMGSSTGNMLVDDDHTISKVFANCELLIATHCESEEIINAQKAKYPHPDSVAMHPIIRNVAACYASTKHTIDLAKKYHSRLHIAHVTTGKETELFSDDTDLEHKRITAEVCAHHLHFTADDYERLGTLIQCNPAIKEASNKKALWKALLDGRIDLIATDHAPHTLEEKQQAYPASPSGLPLVQHSLGILLHYVQEERLSIEQLVEKMCHAPARCYALEERGFLREGYFADLVLVNPQQSTTITKEKLLYKCGWSPLEGFTFPASIDTTFVNGNKVWDAGKILDTGEQGHRLRFHRD